MLFMDKFRKRPACAKVHEEEKYKFIKEQIRPQKKIYVIIVAKNLILKIKRKGTFTI